MLALVDAWYIDIVISVPKMILGIGPRSRGAFFATVDTFRDVKVAR